MKRITRLLPTLPVLLLPFACVDREPLGPGGGPQFAITPFVDGFHFLSPIGHGTSAAGFLGTLSPTVVVCQWNVGSETCTTGTTLAQFSLDVPGTGGATLQVTADNIYQVDWNTTASAVPITHGAVYQVVVQLGGEALGTADIAIYANRSEARNATGDAFPLIDGRTLPIKFGIELAALLDIVGADPNDVVGNDFVVETFTTEEVTQKATVPSGDAAFQVFGGDVQIPGGLSQFTLVIYQKPTNEDGECVESYGGPNAGGCYVFETIPQGVTFLDDDENPVGLAGVCPDENVTDAFLLAKDDDGVTTFPEESAVNIVDCGEIALDRVPRLLRPLARLLLPSALHAKDLGETGTMGAFSTLFWAAPLEVEANPATPLPTGPFAPGQTLALTFRVMSEHNHDETADPVEGVTIDFGVGTGGGTLSTASADSDEDGLVSVHWTLPLVTGAYTLSANVAGTEVGALQFNATATGTFYVANFDVGPTGAAIAAGSVVNNTYATVGISLTKVPAGLAICGSGNQVYANDHGPAAPWFSGSFGFASGQNNVTVCAVTIASDFSENDFGVIEASFPAAVPSVCVDVAPTTPGGSGFLAAYNATGGLLSRVTSTGGVRETLCVTVAGIRSVKFGGDGPDLAIFDNLKLIFITPPPIF